MSDFDTIQKTFDKILGYLKNHNIEVLEKTVTDDPKADLMYNLLLQRKGGKRYPFQVTFFRSMKTFVLLNVSMKFSEVDTNAFNYLKETNKAKHEQLFMDLRKAIYPLNVDIEINIPNFLLTKEVTLEALGDEQFFMDQVHNFLHAIEVVRIRYDEFFYSMYPQGKPKD